MLMVILLEGLDSSDGVESFMLSLRD